MPITFFVPGLPQTKGSARGFVVKGRAVITNDNRKAKPWAAAISATAHEAMNGRAPLTGPVRVEVRFYLPRPKSHRRANGEIKLSAPMRPPTKPDGDKMVRCAWDALTGIVFGDDAQIVEWPGGKHYADDRCPGAWFTIAEVTQ